MNEDERLYEQYEDAFFALLMNRVAEANGKELMQKNEELLTDPDAAVPDRLSKRCLHTIEKSYRKSPDSKSCKENAANTESSCFVDTDTTFYVCWCLCCVGNSSGKNA